MRQHGAGVQTEGGFSSTKNSGFDQCPSEAGSTASGVANPWQASALATLVSAEIEDMENLLELYFVEIGTPFSASRFSDTTYYISWPYSQGLWQLQEQPGCTAGIVNDTVITSENLELPEY